MILNIFVVNLDRIAKPLGSCVYFWVWKWAESFNELDTKLI
jgi:hypothetical protein